MLPEKNIIVFHGAAIEIDGCGLLLLGRSGAGKSTISHKLTESFCRSIKLCDDTFMLEIKDKIFLCPINTGEGYNVEIAKRLYNTGKYDELFYDSEKEKQYIIKKQNYDNKKEINVSKIIFLNRKEDYSSVVSTNITKCNNGKTLINIVNAQTNIATPYTEHKLYLYKQISKEVEAYNVEYNINCDVLKFKEEGII